MAYLDKTGLTYFWSKVKAKLNEKVDKSDYNSHSHSYNDLSNKPTIPTIPSSLPANGGNADTVDNKHIIVSSSAPTSNDTSKITIVI